MGDSISYLDNFLAKVNTVLISKITKRIPNFWCNGFGSCSYIDLYRDDLHVAVVSLPDMAVHCNCLA